jgi:purine-nucleoside phosphorylase
MHTKVLETAQFLLDQGFIADVAVVLGSGLGGLTKEMAIEKEIEYSEIPNFPVSTVEGHDGCLLYGTLGNKKVVAMKGRFHYYEGYSMKEVTFPIRVFNFMGIKNLFLSNAAGGLNPEYAVGDVMVITDHINNFPEHPLRGKNIAEWGTRFPDMSTTYYAPFIELAGQKSAEIELNLKYGVYVGTSGPTYETPAEYKYFRMMGADTVGMSTVPEVIVAHQMGMKIFGVSVVTDSGVPGQIKMITHEEVQKIAAAVGPKLSLLFSKMIVEI